MFWFKYFTYLFGFRSQSELSHMSDVLSKSLINSDVSEDLSRLYKDYSYRIEIKKINKVSMVCARVRNEDEQNEKSVKHWYVYKEISGSVLSWRIN